MTNDHKCSIKSFIYIILILILVREIPTEQIEEDYENLWNFLQSRVNNVQGQTKSTSSAISLMRQYLNMLYQNLNCNVAEWWLSHQICIASSERNCIKIHQDSSDI